MDDDSDTQRMNTVIDFEVEVTKCGNPLSYMVVLSTGGVDNIMLDRSLGDVASFKQ